MDAHANLKLRLCLPDHKRTVFVPVANLGGQISEDQTILLSAITSKRSKLEPGHSHHNLLSQQDFDTIFHGTQELHMMHAEFHRTLQARPVSDV